VLRVTEYATLLEKALPKKKRILGVGKPGVGKTFVNRDVCKRLDMDCIVLCSALEDPSTIRGYPSRGENGEATHCLFDGVAKAFKAKKPTLLLFDDLGMASESTMRAIVRLVQFGEIDNRKLPDCVVIGAATNDVGHGAGVYGMIEPLKSRFHTIVEVETHIDDVIAYGMARDWPSWLCAFLRNSPDGLHDWKPAKTMKVDGACPRGWEYLAEWDKDGIDDVEVWAGCVGKGRATAAAAFKELINELPDLDAVLLDPDSAPVPDNPSARFLVSMGLASKMTAANFGQAVKYLTRLPAMFRAYSIRDAFRAEAERRKNQTLPKDHKALSSSRDFTAWATSQDGKDVMAAAS
jgi:hypothetical protein